jgi:hypothetical protein
MNPSLLATVKKFPKTRRKEKLRNLKMKYFLKVSIARSEFLRKVKVARFYFWFSVIVAKNYRWMIKAFVLHIW